MANHISHASLPYPIRGARFTVFVPYLDADGDPTDPTTPDTEVSKDGAAYADCAEEVSTITGSLGSAYLTLTGAETDCVLLSLAAKAASGPKTTLGAWSPRKLPILNSGTAQAGAAGSITLAAAASSNDGAYVGAIVKTTGGTGGGGSGGANNQARVITAYVGSTRVATVSDNWETTPDSSTTYEVLLTELNTPNAIADALLTRDMSAVTGEASRSLLNAIRFLRNKWSIAGTTLTVTKEDDATSAWTSTVTKDAGADPIIGNDPA